jgi:hypothetical protein
MLAVISALKFDHQTMANSLAHSLWVKPFQFCQSRLETGRIVMSFYLALFGFGQRIAIPYRLHTLD